MKLIDADALIEAMKKTEEEYEDAMTCPSWWTAYNVIKQQPTAYDAEKVVEQIEEMFGCDPMYYGTEAKWAVDKAIDIVKAGGVE